MVFPDTDKLQEDPKLLNPLTLAYMGDAVLELFVRHRLIVKRPGKPNQLHRMATRYVSAKAQSRVLLAMQDELTEEEQWLVRRGRNTKSGTVPKNANIMEYRNSSGFECLLGYLFLTEQRERLQELLEKAFKIVETGDWDE